MIDYPSYEEKKEILRQCFLTKENTDALLSLLPKNLHETVLQNKDNLDYVCLICTGVGAVNAIRDQHEVEDGNKV